MQVRSDHVSNIERERSQRAADRPGRGLRPWQKGLAVLSIVIAALGAVLMMYAAAGSGPPAPSAEVSGGRASGLAGGFAPVEPADSTPDEHAEQTQTDRLIDSASGAIFRLGFGFFAGFAVGYAMRTFVRITLVASGLAVLGLMGLQYAGIISVDWAKISGGFDGFGTWITAQIRDFSAFVTGYLPTFGAGLAGAFVGFRRL
ncbi:MAG: hypothetical protein Kow0022_05570 [Phycisphaerales bacterium]